MDTTFTTRSLKQGAAILSASGWWLGLTAAAAVLCTACSPDGSSSPPNVMVAALEHDPGSLNPAITTNGGVHTASSMLFNGLVGLDEQQQPVPELAVRWEIEQGGALYRFHLRPGVRWHDGRPFTAADVTYSFDQLLLKFHARTRASMGDAIDAVTAVDDSTVEFRFRRPYAPLLQQLNVVEAPILPRHRYEGSDPQQNPANRAPIGTGPFRFVSYAAGAEIRYARNADYFAGAPPLEELVLRVIPDGTTQVLALEAGEVDWLFSVPAAHRERLSQLPEIKFRQTTVNPGGSNCLNTLAFNFDRPVIARVGMRRSIAHALDRALLLERVHFGMGKVAQAPISSRITFAHRTGLPLPAYDTTRASHLLDSMGWRRNANGMRTTNGPGATLTFELKLLPSMAAYGDLIRAQLRAVGVEVVLQPLEQAVFVKAVFEQRDFDGALISYCNGTDPQIGVRRQYASSSIGPVPFSNAAGYRNPVMDSLFERAGGVLEVEERRQIYRDIQEIAVRDLPYLWLIETVTLQAHRSRCTDISAAVHFAATARCR